MSMDQEKLRYSIFDPTGNFTALVESPVAPASRRALAAELMRRHPQLEQVGFVRLPEAQEPEKAVELCMAGGEFCANASMCAAALCALRREAVPETVALRVSGARDEVKVRLRREIDGSFSAAVRMPGEAALFRVEYDDGEQRGTLPGVRMDGITHLVIGPDSVFSALLRDPPRAQTAVRRLCAELDAPCLGLLFWDGGTPHGRLDPLVYVPGSGTLVWENSCASGSAALGRYLSARTGAAVRLELVEPGGVLLAESEPGGETWIRGRTRLIG